MDWHLPLNNDIRQSLAIAEDDGVQSFKQAMFKQHLQAALTPEAWVEVAAAKIGYLRELYPAVWFYGPRAYATERFGTALLAAYKRHGLPVLESLPSLYEISSREFDYLDARLEVEFRPAGEDRPNYTYELEGFIFGLAAQREEEMVEKRGDSVMWLVKDVIEMTLALDIVRQLPFYGNFLTEYDAYRERWDLP